MKKICTLLTFAGIILLAGCQNFRNGFAQNGSDPTKNGWDGAQYKRSTGVGTGIDPQAREIEKRLGYESEWF